MLLFYDIQRRVIKQRILRLLIILCVVGLAASNEEQVGPSSIIPAPIVIPASQEW